MALPNLLIIGAMKCGTTAAHLYLDAHPEIAMAPEKELNFFIGPEAPTRSWHDGNWHRGVDWYAAHFDRAAPVRGETSPGYTSPRFPEAAGRMADLVPDARLVLLVRDPVDRAISQFRHHAAEGTERRSLADALLDPESQYLERSRYRARLAPYLRRFAPERIHVVLQERLLGSRRETVARLYAFAGVDEGVRPPALDRRFHVGTADGPGLDRALEARLVDELAADVAGLRALTGLDLAEWRAYG